eukprot:1003-Chlamydomonas_euryale.AAC.1
MEQLKKLQYLQLVNKITAGGWATCTWAACSCLAAWPACAWLRELPHACRQGRCCMHLHCEWPRMRMVEGAAACT